MGKRFAKIAPGALVLALALPSMAAAQATRTWVSGVGDDANPCSRTAPCKTFAGAISKTAPGGIIDALDPGGFGAITITKAITLDGEATLASILVAGTNGIVVAAGASDVVIVRNLSLEGAGGGIPGVNGISFQSGAALVVENAFIHGFSQSGIAMNASTGGNLTVRNTSITGGLDGISIGGGGTPKASLSGVTIKETTNAAIDAVIGTTDVSNSIITQNGNVGLLAEGGILSAESVMLTGNGIAVWAEPGGTIRLSNNDIFDNLTGLGCGGGTLASAGNNRKAGNGGGGPVCAPNAVITVQ
jgi:hypothetical protein